MNKNCKYIIFITCSIKYKNNTVMQSRGIFVVGIVSMLWLNYLLGLYHFIECRKCEIMISVDTGMYRNIILQVHTRSRKLS